MDGVASLISNHFGEAGLTFWVAAVLFYVLVWAVMAWRGVSLAYMLVLPVATLVVFLLLKVMRDTQFMQHAPTSQEALYYSLAIGAFLQAFGDLLWNLTKAIVRKLSVSSQSDED